MDWRCRRVMLVTVLCAAPWLAWADGAVEEPRGFAAPGDPTAPPPGKPEDQALWSAGHEATAAIHVERHRASRLQLVLANLRYQPRLRLLAERGGAVGEHAAELEQQLARAHGVQFLRQTSRWPVDPYRGCGYPTMEFGSLFAYDAADPVDLERHRRMLVSCIELAGKAVAVMREANDGLATVMKEADAALAGAGLGSPAAGLAAGAVAAGVAGERRGGRDEAREEPGAREQARHAAHEEGEGHARERSRRGKED